MRACQKNETRSSNEVCGFQANFELSYTSRPSRNMRHCLNWQFNATTYTQATSLQTAQIGQRFPSNEVDSVGTGEVHLRNEQRRWSQREKKHHAIIHLGDANAEVVLVPRTCNTVLFILPLSFCAHRPSKKS